MYCSVLYVAIYCFHRGKSALDDISGGGAGGSLYINVINLEGLGMFDVRGGDGGAVSGGGGSGGIVSIYYKKSSNLFSVKLNGGKANRNGASGLFYQHQYVNNNIYTKLFLDNNGLSAINAPSVLICNSKTIDYTFHEVHILGSASVYMVSCKKDGNPMSLIARKAYGDHSGLLITQKYHDTYIGVTGVVLPGIELPFSVKITNGGTLSLPSKVFIGRGITMTISGSLVGVKDMTVGINAKLILEYPGHTGYRKPPVNGKSTMDFVNFYVKQKGSVVTNSPGKVNIKTNSFQQDYGSQFDSVNIPVVSSNKVVEQKGPALSRQDCPHGYQTFAIASPTLYNPCGTGLHVWTKSNISYIVTHNVSKTIYKTVWDDKVSSLQSRVIYYLYNETRYNVTYNIGCNYANFTLLPGQTCTLKAGNYSYHSLTIQGDAVLNFEASTDWRKIAFLTTNKLAIKAGGTINAMASAFDGAIKAQSSHGGSYGGLGGGVTDKNSIYGDIFAPMAYGSFGDGTVANKGKGGGALTIITQELDIDGTVTANGRDGQNGAGGGSGGSLFISSTTMKGSGTLQAHGGTSTGNGGGGGRISVRAVHEMEVFQGSFDVNGGKGAISGGTGTIVFRNTENSPVHDTLLINGNSECFLPTKTKKYKFGRLEIRSGTFTISNQNITATTLKTNKIGKIVVSKGSNVEIDNIENIKKEINCVLNINSGGTLKINNKAVFNGHSSPALSISGLLIAAQPEIGQSKHVELLSNGEIQTQTLKLLTNSSVVVDSSSVIRRSVSLSTIDLLSLILESGSKMSFKHTNIELNVTSLLLRKDSLITSNGLTKTINITSDDLTIESNAKVLVNGGGLLGGTGSPKSSGSGAGHGGQGGGKDGGSAYGSVFEPIHFGSGLSSRGGGIIYMGIKNGFTNNGLVSADGDGDSTGGGSGGTVFMRANKLFGHGKITCNGGSGNSSGGGSGGRIAIYVNDYEYKGVVTAYGGEGKDHGAAGTIFIRQVVTGIALNTTIVDNKKLQTMAKTIIMHEQKKEYTMRLLRLVNSARLEIASLENTQMKIDVLQMDGDNSGSLYVRKNQSLSLSASKAVSEQHFMFPWALIVDEGGTLNLAPKLFITRTQSTPSLYLGGRLIGGQEIVIGQNALVVVAKTGVIGSMSAKPGKFLFRSLIVSSGGRIKFDSDVSLKKPVEIQSLAIDIAYQGVMEGSYLLVKTPSLNIAFSGVLLADKLGHGAGQGPGSGVGNQGGSYGGCGGGNCKLYGSLYRAQEFGSGGGRIKVTNMSEGNGGGIIELQVEKLIIDGLISSNGGHASKNTAGGSGGTVNITISEVMSGRGKIEATGGNGVTTQSAAGGGGRISILINRQYDYKGLLESKGGKGGSLSGSPGTIYIEENRPGVRSKRLIVDNRGNDDKVVHAYLKETSVQAYSFNELGLYGRVILHFEKNTILNKIISDDKSTLHVQDNVSVVIEPDSKSLQPDYNIHVDHDGEIRVPDVVSFRGADNRFAGTLTGVLDMIIDVNRKTQFSATARTARFIDGKYTHITNRGEYQFSTLKIKRLAKLSFENARLKKIPLTVGSLELNYGAILQGSWMDIRASSVTVNSGALIDLSGQGQLSESGPGAGKTVGLSGTGAGHGGYGGNVVDNRGLWYGSATKPNNTGSGGGNGSSGAGGFGGGLLHMKILKILQVDGEIRADGEPGKGAQSGGGSGGSILITAEDIIGNGVIGSEGGNGSSTGGGGSGGRIAIYTQKLLSFEGGFKTLGGTGKYFGAAGTVYIHDNNERVPRKRLWIENHKIVGNRPTTVLPAPSIRKIDFDELKMVGSVRFEIYSSPTIEFTININKFNADGVGEMAVKRNQTLYAEVFEAKESHLTLTTNVHIEEGANMVVSSSLTVDGATLKVDGKISNVRHLVVESGSRVQFGLTSQTTFMKGKEIVFQSLPGIQQFASITLKSGSDFGAPQNLRILVTTLDLKNGVVLRGRFVDIQAQTLLIGRGAALSTNNAISETTKIGSGSNSASGGSGGGHGSQGGSSSANVQGGGSYGTIFRPDKPGSPGGNGSTPGSGGNGGGVILITADYLLNDGYISANGGSGASSSNAGGGSGGSVFLSILKDLRSSGVISANGGTGDGTGGCGAGGRVSIHVKTKFNYRGKLQAIGGTVSNRLRSGGPGTVFIKEQRYKQYYTQLRINSQDQGWNHYVTLRENTDKFVFNELHLYNDASLRMYPTPGASFVLDIRKLYGDKSGLLHVLNNQTMILEVNAPSPVTKTPVNLKVDSGGEAVLATKTYVVGTGKIALEVNGTLTTVRDLFVTQNRKVILHHGAKTSKQKESPATFLFSNMLLYSGSSLTMQDELEMNLIVGFLNIKFGASLSAHHASMRTGKIDVETGALLSCAGGNAARQAVPSAEVSSLLKGAGGGHGSSGGRGSGGPGGLYHGALFQPKDSGRRGGKGNNNVLGGSGGGYIKIEAGNEVINDGTITVSGENAKDGAGGGSGGSIWIKTDVFSGENLSFKQTSIN